MAHHTLRKHPIVLRQVEVTRVVDVTPRMRRVTLTGPQLGAFSTGEFDLPEFTSVAFDDHVKLVFAADGDIAAALPVQRARSIDWPVSEHRRGRDYTPRRWDPEARELDLDFVLHGDGPAVTWATTAKPGDTLYFAGPKSSLVLPDDIDWVLLAGDETALPAIGRFLDERPVDVPVQVVIEIRHESARQDLALRDPDSIRWLVTPESAPSALAPAVREITWHPGQAYVWAAGESRSLIPLRAWLRHDQGLPASHVHVTGYWHTEPSGDDSDDHVDAEALLNPLPWLATRAAVALGLLDQAGQRAVPLDTIAAAAAVEPHQLRPLVTYLATIGVLAAHGDDVTIGPVGAELQADDHLRDEFFGAGYEARLLDALTQLAPALRGGGSAWQAANTRSLADDVETDPVLYADRVHAAESFSFVAGAVADLPAWADAGEVTVTGPGALVLVRAAAERGVLPKALISAAPVPLTVLSDLGADVPASFVPEATAPIVDLVVSTLQTRYRDDAEIGRLLSGLARHADRLLLIDALDQTGPGGPDLAAEHELLALAAVGTGHRDQARIESLALAAGWRLVGHVALGWDYEAFELCR
ncbi:siderophore-interacting protein [Phytoactinopolyspora limicola]|uniref:siderophore-interacting protein n=1 Tax=Phytoactinopolyspora limicola TaxID=2715536 RepID=UPI00140D4B17|nr:siderophore-interacting protein [Phytoactinopolyspora limicola]